MAVNDDADEDGCPEAHVRLRPESGRAYRTEQRATLLVDALRGTPMFQPAASSSCEALVRAARVEAYAVGEELDWTRTTRTCCVLLEGSLELIREREEDGRRLTIGVLEAGELFDVLPLLDGARHMILARALEPVEALAAPVAVVRGLLLEDAAFARSVFAHLASYLRNFEDLAADMTFLDTSVRLARLLLQQADTEPTGSHLPRVQGLSHETMARMIGSVRAVVNRALQELRREGVVELERARVHIKDLRRLLELASRHGGPQT